MATWTYKTDLNPSWRIRQPAYGNDKIYYIDNRYQSPSGIDQNPVGIIYEYDPVGNTQTAIFTPALQDADLLATWSLAWFNGNLYCALELDHITTVEGIVLRWDGTAENWTQVFSTGIDTFDRYIRLFSDDTVMVYYGRDWIDNSGQVFYTSNGSSWNTGSISGAAAGQSTYLETVTDTIVHWPLGIYQRICVNDGGGASCIDSDIYKFITNAFTSFQPNFATELTQSVPNSARHLGNGGYDWMPLDMSTQTQPDPDIAGFQLMNANRYVIGGEIVGNNTNLYTFNTSTDGWDSLEIMTPNLGINPGFTGYGNWIANGSSKAWLLGFNNNTSNMEIWERDEPFPVAIDNAILYWGNNTFSDFKDILL